MRDIMGLMKQAQAMQAKLAEAQAELDTIEVEGQSGGGMVRVTLTAKGAMKGVVIDPSLMKAEEKEIAEDLIVAAHADARAKAERVLEEKMKAMTAGMDLPPGLKLPF
ncbi:MAG TPA: YbaB/EbfC family nucleoid-associated protein [Roseiarcus sp.]|nr:YbaB/EbfC family nucleoid-associated protein [Roseiarcus sp.]